MSIRRTLSLARNGAQMVTHASVRCEDLTAKVLARLIAMGDWLAEPAADLRSASECALAQQNRETDSSGRLILPTSLAPKTLPIPNAGSS